MCQYARSLQCERSLYIYINYTSPVCSCFITFSANDMNIDSVNCIIEYNRYAYPCIRACFILTLLHLAQAEVEERARKEAEAKRAAEEKDRIAREKVSIHE